MSVSTNLESILDSLDTLPAFPEIARRTLELSRDSDVRYKDIIDVIKYDEAITTNCLRLCNSAYYSLRVKVLSLDQAVVMLGLQKITMIVLANCGEFSVYSKAQEGYGLSPGALWRHSVICAILSQLLIKKVNLKEDSILFTAALLHDFGKLVLNNYINGDSCDLIELTQKEELSLIEAEKEAFGIDHAEIGGLIAEIWQFPSMLINSIRNHHKDMSQKFIPNIESWVRLSNLVYYVSLTHSDDSYYRDISCQIDQAILSQFGLKQKHVDEATVELPIELKKMKDLLKIAI